MKCVICGKKIIGEKHNAYPISRGNCCGKCNNIVIKKRLVNIEIKQ